MKQFFSKLSLICLAACLCGLLAACSDKGESEEHNHEGTPFVLGDLNVVVYGSEYVVDKDGEGCLEIYLHVENKGDVAKSVMGSYPVKRWQGESGTLRVAVAYNDRGNLINTAGELIDPGEVRDVSMCFKLVDTSPVSVTFGSEELGSTETTMSFPVVVPEEKQ